jgi:hypothetical protein
MPDEFIERLEYDEYEPPTEAHTKRILAKQTFIDTEVVE